MLLLFPFRYLPRDRLNKLVELEKKFRATQRLHCSRTAGGHDDMVILIPLWISGSIQGSNFVPPPPRGIYSTPVSARTILVGTYEGSIIYYRYAYIHK